MVRPRKSETEFLTETLNRVTFRVRGTVDQQRLRQGKLVEFFSLRETVSKSQVPHKIHILGTPATIALNATVPVHAVLEALRFFILF